MPDYLAKLSKAEQWLSEARNLSELKEIHDIAVAAEAYAEAHRLGVQAANHALEVRLLAARRIGELVPAVSPKDSGKMAHGREVSEVRTPDISKQRLSEFRKLASIPLAAFRKKISDAKDRNERISYSKFLSSSKFGTWQTSSETAEWETPQALFDLLNTEFSFGLDVCATAQNTKCKQFYSRKDNGLLQSWHGACWMNPPYGDAIPEWMNKVSVEVGRGALVVCLVPARTDTEWWWDNAIAGEVRFLRGRLRFSEQGSAPFPSAVVIRSSMHDKRPRVVWWNKWTG